MLIYHFGSREGLLAEVVGVVEAQQRDTLATLTDAADADPREVALRFWSLVVGPALRYGPLFFELSAHTMQAQPHAEALRAALVGPWLDPLTRLMAHAGHDPASARVHARIGLAVARGLLHDVLVTGDVEAANAAMTSFVDLLLGERLLDRAPRGSWRCSPRGEQDVTMKVLILTLGTRGDVQPFVALATALLRTGHHAVVAAPSRFAEFVGGHGVPFAALDDGPLRLMDTGSTVADVAAGGARSRLALATKLPAMFTQVLEDCWTAATGAGAGADVVVHNGQVIGGHHIAEKLGVPAVLALPLPMYVPTREFPWPGQEFPARMPAALNRATFLGMKGPAVMFGRTVDRWRKSTLGLPRRRGRHDPLRRPDGGTAPVMHAVSPHVLPRPADWPATATTTGYWFLGPTGDVAASGLAADLEAFLAAGEPPVYIGFGSMSGADPAAVTATVLDTVDRARVRAVLATGWGGLVTRHVPEDVFVLDQAPHDQLFPRVAAIVHHGGAGTTGAAAAAGRPQVVCPFVADQPFWGRRMHALGVAPAPIMQRRLTAENLAAAIRAVRDDPALAARAAELGSAIRAEDGVAAAVEQLEQLSARPERGDVPKG
ncbi:MAG: nucleotide disphospho-sugar-binding domain-containing protein [Pseudonocardiaceae bacterium]